MFEEIVGTSPALQTVLSRISKVGVREIEIMPGPKAQVGDDEVLLDDSRRYVERAVAAGVDAKLDI